MIAIIWKELRENLKWAVLWVIALTICLALVPLEDRWKLLCGEVSLILLLCTSCGGGLLLGMAQVVPERARDQWAFLVHRPLSLTRIFLAKIIAGLGLYLAAMLIPLFLAAFWISRPGRIPAPFDWQMTLPAVAIILNGAVWYFAALVIGTRRARWYASAVLPISIAVLSTSGLFLVPEFWQALIVAAIAGAILGTAAWGSFTAGGQSGSQSLVARVALCIAVMCGVMVLIVVPVVAALDGARRLVFFTWYDLDRDGQILKHAFDSRTRTHETVDLQGKAVAWQSSGPLADLRGRTDFHAWEDWPYFSAYRYVRPVNLMGGMASWYFSCRERLLLGYDIRTRRLVGSIGPDGPVPAGQAPGRRFAYPPLQPAQGYSDFDYSRLVVFPDGIYRLDATGRRLELIAPIASPPVTSVTLLRESWESSSAPFSIAVTSGSRVQIFDEDARSLFSFDLHWPEYRRVAAARAPGGQRYVIWYQKGSWRHRDWPQRVVELDSSGHELRRYDLPTLPAPVFELRPSRGLLGAAIPLIGLPAKFIIEIVESENVDQPYVQWREYVVDHTLYSGMFISSLLVSAALCAGGIWLLAKRYAFEPRARWLWTVIGFLTGPASVLTLLALRDWPVRVACPACAKPRVVTRDNCEHCGASFTRPAPDPADIFENAPAERSLATAL